MGQGQQSARLRADLLSRKVPISHRPCDLIAAATALTYDLMLVTGNVRDCRDIPGRRIPHSRGGQC